MEAVNKEEDANPLPKGNARSERVQTLAEVNRRIDRHLYNMVLYAELAKEVGKTGNTTLVITCGALIMEHLNTIAKLANEDLSQKLIERLAGRSEGIPIKTIEALKSEVSLRVRRTVSLLESTLEKGDLSRLGQVKSSQDRIERLATLLGDHELVAFAKVQKGSCYVEAAAEQIFGPDEALDRVTRMEKALVATDLSPHELLKIQAELESSES